MSIFWIGFNNSQEGKQIDIIKNSINSSNRTADVIQKFN